MRIHECPTCHYNGRLFELMSRNAWFDFYRCSCGYVWTVARADDGDQEQRDATPRRPERAAPASLDELLT